MSRDERENRPQPLLPRLQALDPERDVVYTAIDRLTKPAEIRQFVGEYLERRTSSVAEGKKGKVRKTLMGNIGFILGQYESDVSQRWFDTVEGLSHPIFGRTIPHDDPIETEAKIAVHDLLKGIQGEE